MLSSLFCAIPAVELPTFAALRLDNSILSSDHFNFLLALVKGWRHSSFVLSLTVLNIIWASVSLIEDFVFLLAAVTWYNIPVQVYKKKKKTKQTEKTILVCELGERFLNFTLLGGYICMTHINHCFKVLLIVFKSLSRMQPWRTKIFLQVSELTAHHSYVLPPELEQTWVIKGLISSRNCLWLKTGLQKNKLLVEARETAFYIVLLYCCTSVLL